MRAVGVDERLASDVRLVPARSVAIDGSDAARDEVVAAEAPLEVRIGGRAVTVLMRTPGNDEELVTGFLFCEGVIADADELIGIEVPEGLADSDRGNVVDVRLMTSRPVGQRHFFSNSGCGVCGKQSLASVEVRGKPVTAALTVSRSLLTGLPEKLRAAQPLFERTGGAHASALFTPTGELVALREDVGRHNALDKLVGWALGEGRVPLSEYVLLVSGRVSYELVQKSIAAGLPLVAAVGAPSSLAIEMAERFGITLVGFLRAGGMNIYAHPRRVAI